MIKQQHNKNNNQKREGKFNNQQGKITKRQSNKPHNNGETMQTFKGIKQNKNNKIEKEYKIKSNQPGTQFKNNVVEETKKYVTYTPEYEAKMKKNEEAQTKKYVTYTPEYEAKMKLRQAQRSFWHNGNFSKQKKAKVKLTIKEQKKAIVKLQKLIPRKILKLVNKISALKYKWFKKCNIVPKMLKEPKKDDLLELKKAMDSSLQQRASSKSKLRFLARGRKKSIYMLPLNKRQKIETILKNNSITQYYNDLVSYNKKLDKHIFYKYNYWYQKKLNFKVKPLKFIKPLEKALSFGRVEDNFQFDNDPFPFQNVFFLRRKWARSRKYKYQPVTVADRKKKLICRTSKINYTNLTQYFKYSPYKFPKYANAPAISIEIAAQDDMVVSKVSKESLVSTLKNQKQIQPINVFSANTDSYDLTNYKRYIKNIKSNKKKFKATYLLIKQKNLRKKKTLKHKNNKHYYNKKFNKNKYNKNKFNKNKFNKNNFNKNKNYKNTYYKKNNSKIKSNAFTKKKKIFVKKRKLTKMNLKSTILKKKLTFVMEHLITLSLIPELETINAISKAIYKPASKRKVIKKIRLKKINKKIKNKKYNVIPTIKHQGMQNNFIKFITKIESTARLKTKEKKKNKQELYKRLYKYNKNKKNIFYTKKPKTARIKQIKRKSAKKIKKAYSRKPQFRKRRFEFELLPEVVVHLTSQRTTILMTLLNNYKKCKSSLIRKSKDLNLNSIMKRLISKNAQSNLKHIQENEEATALFDAMLLLEDKITKVYKKNLKQSNRYSKITFLRSRLTHYLINNTNKNIGKDVIGQLETLVLQFQNNKQISKSMQAQLQSIIKLKDLEIQYLTAFIGINSSKLKKFCKQKISRLKYFRKQLQTTNSKLNLNIMNKSSYVKGLLPQIEAVQHSDTINLNQKQGLQLNKFFKQYLYVNNYVKPYKQKGVKVTKAVIKDKITALEEQINKIKMSSKKKRKTLQVQVLKPRSRQFKTLIKRSHKKKQGRSVQKKSRGSLTNKNMESFIINSNLLDVKSMVSVNRGSQSKPLTVAKKTKIFIQNKTPISYTKKNKFINYKKNKKFNKNNKFNKNKKFKKFNKQNRFKGGKKFKKKNKKKRKKKNKRGRGRNIQRGLRRKLIRANIMLRPQSRTHSEYKRFIKRCKLRRIFFTRYEKKKRSLRILKRNLRSSSKKQISQALVNKHINGVAALNLVKILKSFKIKEARKGKRKLYLSQVYINVIKDYISKFYNVQANKSKNISVKIKKAILKAEILSALEGREETTWESTNNSLIMKVVQATGAELKKIQQLKKLVSTNTVLSEDEKTRQLNDLITQLDVSTKKSNWVSKQRKKAVGLKRKLNKVRKHSEAQLFKSIVKTAALEKTLKGSKYIKKNGKLSKQTLRKIKNLKKIYNSKTKTKKHKYRRRTLSIHRGRQVSKKILKRHKTSKKNGEEIKIGLIKTSYYYYYRRLRYDRIILDKLNYKDRGLNIEKKKKLKLCKLLLYGLTRIYLRKSRLLKTKAKKAVDEMLKRKKIKIKVKNSKKRRTKRLRRLRGRAKRKIRIKTLRIQQRKEKYETRKKTGVILKSETNDKKKDKKNKLGKKKRKQRKGKKVKLKKYYMRRGKKRIRRRMTTFVQKLAGIKQKRRRSSKANIGAARKKVLIKVLIKILRSLLHSSNTNEEKEIRNQIKDIIKMFLFPLLLTKKQIEKTRLRKKNKIYLLMSQIFLYNIKQIVKSENYSLNFFGIIGSNLTAEFIMRRIKERMLTIKQGSGFRVVPKIMKMIIRSKHIVGFKFKYTGRLTGNSMAQKQIIQKGRVGNSSMRVFIDYAQDEILRKHGKCGMKLWVVRNVLTYMPYKYVYTYNYKN